MKNKSRLLALLLCLVMFFNTFIMSSCDVIFGSDIDPDEDEIIEDEGKEEDDGTTPDGEGDTDGGDVDPDGSGSDAPSDDEDEKPDWGGGTVVSSYRISEEKLRDTLEKTLSKIDFCIESYGEGKFPGAYSKNYIYKSSENKSGWVQGFWPGVLWHAYELSGEDKYKDVASGLVDSFYTRIDKKLGVDNHDLGFLYTPSCIAAYKITGDDKAKEAAVMAADQLLTRYHADAGFIQAWGEMGDDAEYRLIIDCLMNLPLLYWATEETGDEKYADAALTHFLNTARTVYREDGSTYHTYYFDPETNEPAYGKTKQGYKDESAWSRGQAWGMYGALLTYQHTGDERAYEMFELATNYFLKNITSGIVPVWDFKLDSEAKPIRDTSAAVIASCALLEAADMLDDSDANKNRYLNFAHRMMEALIDDYTTFESQSANGILIGVTQSYWTEASHEQMAPYGDYFFLEVLHRMLDSDYENYW